MDLKDKLIHLAIELLDVVGMSDYEHEVEDLEIGELVLLIKGLQDELEEPSITLGIDCKVVTEDKVLGQLRFNF